MREAAGEALAQLAQGMAEAGHEDAGSLLSHPVGGALMRALEDGNPDLAAAAATALGLVGGGGRA